jgi:ABC-2 type transport system permease protein
VTAISAPPSSGTRPRRSGASRYAQVLWLLTTRDLKVRYSTSALGYLWSVLDPLVMAAIYWFVFTQVFNRGGGIGEQPYIVFLLAGLLPWTWFTGAVSESTRAFVREAKLVRSTNIPRTIWVVRVVLSKGIEFLFSLPVIAAFALASLATDEPAHLTWGIALLPLAVLLQVLLTLGVGLIVAPLVVFFRDLERAVKLALRFLFYASPIIYALPDLGRLEVLGALNPLAGIFSLYRAAFFPEQLEWYAVGISAGVSLILLAVGAVVFRRSIRGVLKEI